MKSIYRKINTNLVTKMVSNAWRGTTEYNKNVKNGVQLEGGNKDTLHEVIKYNFVMSCHGVPFETIVEYNPYKFKNIWLKPTNLSNSKIGVSNKCLYAYAYRGKYLKQYYENGMLNKEALKEKIEKSELKTDIEDSIKEVQLENGFEDVEIVNEPQLKMCFKSSKMVWVSEASKQIFVLINYTDYGYNIDKMHMRYGAYMFDESKWINDQQAIDATCAKLKTIQKLSNGPEQFDVESYLMWIGGQTKKQYVNDYIKLLNRISCGGIKWHQDCELRMKDSDIESKYRGYKIEVFEEFFDPISEEYALKSIQKTYCVGHDYENDEDMIGLYDPVYKDDSLEEK